MAIIGEILLYFSIFLCLVSALGAFKKSYSNQLVISAFVGSSLLNVVAFFVLIYSFAVSDFSLKLVYDNSHTLKPLFYKITSTWGNHEGSMLLFITLLSVVSFYIIWHVFLGLNKAKAIANIAFVKLLLLVFLVFTSNPFAELLLAPQEGLGFNPILQDLALSFHPPLLYTGYIGFIISYAFIVVGTNNNTEHNIARRLVLFAWSFLTLGILAGSWWAYRELGWGGFWFWDPVENSSLIPWLCGTALLHCFFMPKTQANSKWLVGISISVFLTCFIGFFLVRSGILTSVHSFAADSDRGLYMLLIFVIFAITSIYNFCVLPYTNSIVKTNNIRTKFINANNIGLLFLALIVLLGTIYPLLVDYINNQQISVGPEYFATIFEYATALLLPICALGLFFKQKLYITIASLALVVGIFVVVLYKSQFNLLSLAVLLSSVFLAVNLLLHFILEKNRLKTLPKYIAHFGLLVLVLGVVLTSIYSQQFSGKITKDSKINFAAYNISLVKITEDVIDNYAFREAKINIFKDNAEIGDVYPQQRLYPVENKKTSETGIINDGFSDVYFALGDKLKDQEAYALRIYFKAYINLVWLGGLLMFLSGIIRLLFLVVLNKKLKTS